MTFDEEPEWMRKARQVPVQSTWESRQPYQNQPLGPGSSRAEKPANES